MSILPQRELCTRCLRPHSTCYCSQIRSFHSKIKIVILQHPIERKKGIGTARMAHLCIQSSILIQGKSFENDQQVESLIHDPKNFPVILFPGPHAIPLESSAQFPNDRNLIIFVIDGTWTQAKRMLRLSPNLARLPYVSFNSQRESQYIIRQQPMAHCLSSIESIHEILGILEPDLNADNLIEIFQGMVKYQINANPALSPSARRTLHSYGQNRSPLENPLRSLDSRSFE